MSGPGGPPRDSWGVGAAYERYMGRWSRVVATKFLAWLQVPRSVAWADVGCGTGALADRILALCDPRAVAGIDRSEGFVREARRRVPASRVTFTTADATALPWRTGGFDAAVSGLVLNFVPDHASVVREMARVTRAGGTIAAYVWDYAGGMAMLRHFWDAAMALSPRDAELDEAQRFPVCQPDALDALFRDCGLRGVAVRAIDVPTTFQDFEDYWAPFLGEQGSAPTYLATVDGEMRQRIREALRSRLAPRGGGPIELTARAWAVKGLAGE